MNKILGKCAECIMHGKYKKSMNSKIETLIWNKDGEEEKENRKKDRKEDKREGEEEENKEEDKKDEKNEETEGKINK